jgi:mannosyltransferase
VSGAVRTTPELGHPSHFPARQGRTPRLLIVIGVAVTVVGVGLRFYCPSALWLDETLSVNISRLTLEQIPAALHQDGAPPLYYVMLHMWMDFFGEGDVAVRALSGLMSVITLPLFWYAGFRLGGRRVAWITYFLALTSPFLIQYATTTRMYSLMVLMSVLGFLAIGWALERPSWRRLTALGLVTGGVLYTHYWGIYLVGMTGLWLIYLMWRAHRGLPTRHDPTAVRRCFGAMVLGCLLFVPWGPTFVFQSLHTGTPWSSAAGPQDILNIFADYAGSGPWAELLTFFYVVLLILGVFGRPPSAPSAAAGLDVATVGATNGSVAASAAEDQLFRADLDGEVHPVRLRSAARRGLDRVIGVAGFGPGGSAGTVEQRTTLTLGSNPRTLPLFGVLTGTLVVAMLAGAVFQAAFVARYTAVVIPLFLLIVAVGTDVFRERRIVAGTLAVICVAGLFTGYGDNSQQRTEAVNVAAVLNAQAKPGDLVVYCPDQLGPAVDRLLKVPAVTELTFPRAIGPSRVDWINYVSVIDRTNVETFAEEMRSHVGADNTIWLVWNRSYHGFGQDCGDLETWLSYFQGSGTTEIHAASGFYESEILTRFPSTATSS